MKALLDRPAGIDDRPPRRPRETAATAVTVAIAATVATVRRVAIAHRGRAGERNEQPREPQPRRPPQYRGDACSLAIRRRRAARCRQRGDAATTCQALPMLQSHADVRQQTSHESH